MNKYLDIHPEVAQALAEEKLYHKQQYGHSHCHTDIPMHGFTFHSCRIGAGVKTRHIEI